MKKTIRFFAMLAMVSGAMFFAACDDDDDEEENGGTTPTPTPDLTYANVNYNGTTWAATTVAAGTAQGDFITLLFENYTNDQSETVYLVGGTTTGTFKDDEDEYYWFYNHHKETFNYEGDTYPVWESDGMEQKISAIDMNAKTYTFTAEGFVYNAEVYNGDDVANTYIRHSLDVRVNSEWQSVNFSKEQMPKPIRRK